MTFKKGRTPWNKNIKTGIHPKTEFKKGYIPHNKGKKGLYKHTEEERKRRSERMKGNTFGFKIGHKTWNKDSKGLTKANKTSFKKGHITWNKNKKCPHLIGNKHAKGRGPNKTSFKKGDMRIVGKNNPNWKDGITPYVEKLRKSIEYKLWREAVFKRDNYTCQECNLRSGCGKTVYLEAHHEIPFTECLALDWEDEIYDVDNGTTLCMECHLKSELHKNIGRRSD